MGDLNFIVVPEINAHWEDVAFALRFEIADVDSINEKCNGDPKKCCKQLFRDWLSTNKGVKPTTWQVLLKKLKEVDDLTTAVENIISKLKTNY